MKSALFSLGLAAVLGLVGGCASQTGHFAPVPPFPPATDKLATTTVTNLSSSALLQPANNPFTLGPGDTVEIEILGTPASRAIATVGLDGKIYYQLLPGQDVWGLTLRQTAALLEHELAQYVNNPQVSVVLRTVGSKYIWVLGRLAKPGIYPLPGSMTLLESLALAGGPSGAGTQNPGADLADLRHSFVMRQGQLLPVDFTRLLHEGDMSQNVRLEPDDFVYVPSVLSQQVYVMGAVRTPHAIVYQEQMGLVSAIAAANGGVKFDYLASYYEGRMPDADLSHIAVVRGSLAQPQAAIIDFRAIMKGKEPDVLLEPGDIIYVPNSPFRTLKTYVNIIVNAFVTTVAANEGIRMGGGTVGTTVAVPVGGR